MNTWNSYRAKVKEAGGAAEILMELGETTGQITVAMYEARERLGISQRELARLSGLTQSAIGRFETGATIPRLDTLVKMLTPLGLKLQALEDTEFSDVQASYRIRIDVNAVKRAAGKMERLSERNMIYTQKSIGEVREVQLHG